MIEQKFFNCYLVLLVNHKNIKSKWKVLNKRKEKENLGTEKFFFTRKQICQQKKKSFNIKKVSVKHWVIAPPNKSIKIIFRCFNKL